MALEWLLFSNYPTSCRIWNTWTILMRWSPNPNRGYNHFSYEFRTSMYILFIIKVNTLMLINWSYRSPTPKLCWLLSLKWLSCLEYVVQSLLNTHFFGVRSLIYTKPHTTQIWVSESCPNRISNQIRHLYLKIGVNIKRTLLYMFTNKQNCICIEEYECHKL